MSDYNQSLSSSQTSSTNHFTRTTSTKRSKQSHSGSSYESTPSTPGRTQLAAAATSVDNSTHGNLNTKRRGEPGRGRGGRRVKHENTSTASSTAAAAAASSSAASSSTSAVEPILLSRKDWNLIEEIRQVPLSECFTYQELPFLWSCAAGNVKAVKGMLKEEQIEQQTKELKRIEREAKAVQDGQVADDVQEPVEETYIQQVDSIGWTALHWAAAFDHVDIMELLFAAFLESIPEHTNPSVDAPIILQHHAASEFLPPVYLFINRTTQFLDTPLHIACMNCHINAMNWLLQHGADITARCMEGRSTLLGQTPLMCIVEKKTRKETLRRQAAAAKWMIQQIRRRESDEWLNAETPELGRQLQQINEQQMTCKQPKRMPIYHLASENPIKSLPETISDSPAEFKTELKPTFDVAASALDSSQLPPEVKMEFEPTVNAQLLIKDEPMVIDDTPPDSIYSKPDPSAEVDHTLIKPTSVAPSFPLSIYPMFSALNDRRKSGSTALIIAAFGGNYDVVLELLQNGAMVDLELHDFDGRRVNDSALLNSVDEGHVRITRLLLEWGANRFIKNCHNETPFLLVCSSDQECYRKDEQLRITMLKILLYEGVPQSSLEAVKTFLLTEPDHRGATPFIWSVRRGCLAVIQFLVELGCNLNDLDPSSGASVIVSLCKRIRSHRLNKKANKKKVDHVHVCTIMKFFLTHPRCVHITQDVPAEMKQYILNTVASAEEAAALAASALQAAEQTRENLARKRGRQAPTTPPKPVSTPLKSSSKKTTVKREQISSVKQPTSSSLKAKGSKKSGSFIKTEKPPAKPSTPLPPPRFFKGGRQTLPELARGQTKHHRSQPGKNMLGSSDEEEEDEDHLHRPRSYGDESKSMEVDDDEDADPTAILYDSDGDMMNGAPPPPPPTQLQPRIRGSIGAKLNKASPNSSNTNLIDLSTSEMDHGTAQPNDLNGELNHESQIDEFMFDDPLNDPHHQMNDDHQNHPHHQSSDDPMDLHASPSASAILHPDSLMDHHDSSTSSYQLSLMSSPDKYSSHSTSHLYSSVSKSIAMRDLSRAKSPMLGMHTHHDPMVASFLASPAPPIHTDAHHLLAPTSMTRQSSFGSDGEFSRPSIVSAHPPTTHSSGPSALASASGPTTQHPSTTSTPSSVPALDADDGYAEVRHHLTALGLSSYIATFITNEMPFSAWSILADGSNDDMLKELIPPAGPRLKFRNFAREHCLHK